MQLPKNLPPPALSIFFSGLMDAGGWVWTPGTPAADIYGLLLEGNWNSFNELEDASGVLLQEGH